MSSARDGDHTDAAAPGRESPNGDSGSGLLGPTTIGFLRHEGQEIGFTQGEVIVRRGERQDFFYVVVEGEVELLLQEGGAYRRSLARLGVGATFGAESVVGKAGAAVDAVAVTDVRLLRYPASAVEAALRDSDSLRSKLLGGIARNLHDATEDALDLLKGTETIVRLVQGEGGPDELIAVSARMRGVKGRIESCSRTTSPVLITGPPGSGKTLAARRIHQGSARRQGTLIAVNCRRLAPEHATELILGRAVEADSGSLLRGGGGIHFAAGGTLLLRHVDALPPASQEELAGYLGSSEQPGCGGPDTRIIATACASDSDHRKCGELDADLVNRFADVIVVPPLAQRKRDILPLAEAMLERAGPRPPHLTESARHAILESDYRRHNVSELSEVVELARRVADGQEIRAEHILGGGEEAALPPGVDLATGPEVPWWCRRPLLRAVRVAVATVFASVIVLCLVAPDSSVGKLANASIWTSWEPVVFALFLLAGPLWCTLCPLSTAGRLTGRIRSLDRPPPKWMVGFGPWLAVLGFVLIVWSERAFRMTGNPRPSGIMLGSLVAAAVVFALFYRREVWCRHLCPLGRLAVALAPASPLQLTARRSFCASSCQTHACYTGAGSIPGCTVFHHPIESKKAHHCKLCLDCLHSCPHGSSRLQLRPPLAAMWRLDAGAADVAIFCYAVSVLALGLLIPRRFPQLLEPLNLALVCLAAVGLGWVLHRTVGWLFRRENPAHVTATRVGFVLMLLGWTALMAAQLENVPLITGASVQLQAATWWPPWIPHSLPVLTVLQVFIVGAASVAAMVALWQVRRQQEQPSRAAWLVTLGIFAGFGLSTLALVI